MQYQFLDDSTNAVFYKYILENFNNWVVSMKKICTGCRRNRRIGKFARDNSRKDGKRIYCRDCIRVLNRNFRLSPIGRLNHRKSVVKWKKNNKDAIREYNKVYYERKNHIIRYNKKCREETESVLIFGDFENRTKFKPRKENRVDIVINPRRKSVRNQNLVNSHQSRRS